MKLCHVSGRDVRSDLKLKIADQLREAAFLHRENRFSCLVELQGKREMVYLPNSGRLNTVLFPEQKVFVTEKTSPSRKTKYDLVMASLNNGFVSVDSRLPGNLVYQALCKRQLPQFSHYPSIKREAVSGRSRLDFLLSGDSNQCFLEVKSVTLVKEGKALFPDAPTSRGRRHLESLIQSKSEGYEAAILFVIQREDADRFSSNDGVDPDFGHALRIAKLQGVSIYAYRCKVCPWEIELADQIPVYL